MENKLLEKNYKIPIDIFREGYKAYQRKFVNVRRYILTAVFLVLTANFIYGAVKDSDNYIAYILIVICLALAFREWYNPLKLRNSVIESCKELGDPLYCLTVTDDEVIISTETGENDETDEPPEPARLPVNDELSALEYDDFFLIVYGKLMFYIVPKADFSETELDVIRNLTKGN